MIEILGLFEKKQQCAVIPVGHRAIVGEHHLLRERANMDQFTPFRGDGTVGRQDVIEKVDALCLASPFDASDHTIAYCCFHRRQSFQFCDRHSQILQGMEKREAFEDLHDRSKRIEGEENIEMYRVFPCDTLTAQNHQDQQLIGSPTVSHLVELFAPCHICRLIHGQPIRPLHQPDPGRRSTKLLHLHDKIVYIIMRYRLQSLDRPATKRGRKFLRNLAMANGVLFPDNAPQILTSILEIRFDKDLKALLMRSVDIWKCI